MFFVFIYLLFTSIACFVYWLYLERYWSIKPLEVISPPISERELRLQKVYPDLKELREKWIKAKTEIIYQDWNWNKLYRPKQPIQAFVYRFLLRNLWRRKLRKYNEVFDEYQVCLKLLDDEHDSFQIHKA